MTITCSGQSGHGSLLFKNTPGEKIHYIIDKFMSLRKIESEKLENNPELTIGDVTTVSFIRLFSLLRKFLFILKKRQILLGESHNAKWWNARFVNLKHFNSKIRVLSK